MRQGILQRGDWYGHLTSTNRRIAEAQRAQGACAPPITRRYAATMVRAARDYSPKSADLPIACVRPARLTLYDTDKVQRS